MLKKDSIIIIPARMKSSRLPGKPLADIAGKPMIVRVAQQAQKAFEGTILVATDHKEILNSIQNAGFKGFLTQKDHHSGSDRIYEALCAIDTEGQYQHIINLQGDLPNINPESIAALLKLSQESSADIVTLGTPIVDIHDMEDPNLVKIIATPRGYNRFEALYFTRSCAPYGQGPRYQHIGIYGYKREALEKFVQLPPSFLEQQEKLEQLRALENHMRIEGCFVTDIPISVDTPEDLELINQHFYKNL